MSTTTSAAMMNEFSILNHMSKVHRNDDHDDDGALG